jgi:hypothetical protein
VGATVSVRTNTGLPVAVSDYLLSPTAFALIVEYALFTRNCVGRKKWFNLRQKDSSSPGTTLLRAEGARWESTIPVRTNAQVKFVHTQPARQAAVNQRSIVGLHLRLP